MRKVFFLTGTDTEIGKTTVACGLLAAAMARGLSTAAIKPVASGCIQTDDGLRNADALRLWRLCSQPLAYREVNPAAFEPAIAPHIAAEECGRSLSVDESSSSVMSVVEKAAEFTLIEGAGGWRVPLNREEYLSSLAVRLRFPVILVVGIRLGCINHALLTAEAIVRDDLPLSAWVANIVDPETSRIRENLETLRSALTCPCLGIVPHMPDPNPEAVAAHLALDALLDEGDERNESQ
jgi:dethiobiotin synthetase